MDSLVVKAIVKIVGAVGRLDEKSRSRLLIGGGLMLLSGAWVFRLAFPETYALIVQSVGVGHDIWLFLAPTLIAFAPCWGVLRLLLPDRTVDEGTARPFSFLNESANEHRAWYVRISALLLGGLHGVLWILFDVW